MKCVSYTRTLPWKNHQGELAIAEQNQRIAAYLAEHKELDLLKKYSDRKNDEKARIAFDKMTDDGVERKFDCIIVASMYYCGPVPGGTTGNQGNALCDGHRPDRAG